MIIDNSFFDEDGQQNVRTAEVDSESLAPEINAEQAQIDLSRRQKSVSKAD